ncbi:MAG: hypothetical protein QS748_13650 [Candidatus Endonucleobacter bathymodioli]|uniref:Uncharacterized protein n=1 Tax=Candidatus Endonucleibacter bathymodioli TaxID=539814 RepID=A0AA90NVN0_9GAMM|nr:hypothetical protein [Candidatus Endonucleobacter bathymodioli]
MAHIRTVIVFFKALSSKKYNLINSGAYAALSCKGLIIIGFILGGTSGVLLYTEFLFRALFVPAAVCLTMAAIYRIYAKNHS